MIDGGIYRLMMNRFGTRQHENPTYYYAISIQDQTAEHTYESAGVHIEGNVYWDLFQEGNQDYQNGNTEAIWVAQMSLDLCQQGYTANRMAHSCNYSPVARDVQGELMGSLEDVGGEGVTAVMPTYYTRDIIYEDKWAEDMRNSEAVFRRTFVGNQKNGNYYGKVVPWDVLHKVSNGVKDRQAETFLFPISCKIATDKYSGYIAHHSIRTMRTAAMQYDCIEWIRLSEDQNDMLKLSFLSYRISRELSTKTYINEITKQFSIQKTYRLQTATGTPIFSTQ